MIAITFQLVLLLYHQLTTGIDLYPFNGVRSTKLAERRTEQAVNGVLMGLPVIGFVFRIDGLIYYAVAYYFILLAVEVATWWMPYLFGASDRWLEVYLRVHSSTLGILPGRDQRTAPNLEHLILMGAYRYDGMLHVGAFQDLTLGRISTSLDPHCDRSHIIFWYSYAADEKCQTTSHSLTSRANGEIQHASRGARVLPALAMAHHSTLGTSMIRLAHPSDAAAICEIYNHYVLHTPITFEEEAVSESEMASRISEITAVFPWLIWEGDEGVVGYAYASKWKVRGAYRYSAESTVYLRQDQVGRGIGRKLYEELIGRLGKAGIHCVIGGVALPNVASQRLHETLGFKKVAHFEQVGRKFGKWIDVGYWELILGSDA